MALIIKDRVLETCSSPGSGSVTLLGAVTGYQSFNAAVGNGNTCYYAIADQNGNNWEVGVGTFTAPATLARTTILASSNGGSVVNFSTGTQNVFLTYPAAKSVTTDTLAYPPAIGGTTPNAGSFTTLTATADSSFTSTGAVLLSKGTTAEQPGVPVTGMIRYNTTTNTFEGYSGASPGWNSVGGIALVNDTTTATAIYPLLASATSGTVGTQYTSNSKLLYVPSTGKFTSTILNGGSVTSDSGVQIGTNATAANNFTWYQPASPDGTVRLGVGNVGVTTSDRITVSSSATTIAGTTNLSTATVSTLLNLPSWTTGTRPGSPTAGMTGYNSTTGYSETYNGTTWVSAGGLVQQSVQTGNFNAAVGNSYPVNTTSGKITVTLPASPTTGDQINIFDYAGTAATNSILIAPNGGKINGTTNNGELIQNRTSVTLAYVNTTQGWIVISDCAQVLNRQSITVTYAIIGGGGRGNGGGTGGDNGTYSTSTATLQPSTVYTIVVGGSNTASTITGSGVSVSAAGGGITSSSEQGGKGLGGSNSGLTGGPAGSTSITGSSILLGGGGGGSTYSGSSGPGGSGIGGSGSTNAASSGVGNTGSGGGGVPGGGTSYGQGGSGTVFISIPTSMYSGTTTGSPTVTTNGSNTVMRFTSSGTYTA